MVLEAGRPEVRAPARLGSGEGRLPGLQMAVFLLGFHRVERERGKLSGLFFKDINPIMGCFTLVTSSNPILSQRSHL